LIIIRAITSACREFQALFLKVLPPTGGAAGSFFAVGARLVAAAGAFAVGALRAGAAFFVPVFVTIVVPILLELPPLSRRSLVSGAVRVVAGRFVVCLLCARDEGLGDLVIEDETVGFIGLAGREDANDDSFSIVVDLMGDRGNACELLDLGERTVVRAGLRDAVFVVAVGAVVAVFVRFLGLGISPWAYAFSLSSVPKCSLLKVSRVMRMWRGVFLPRSLQALPRRRWRDSSLSAINDRHDRRRPRLCFLCVVVQEVLHVALSQRLGDPVHAHLQSRTQSLRL
jgi:hypothetical protein